MAIEIVGIEIAYQGWGRYLVATIRMPDGRTIRHEIEDHGSAVGVLAFDPARRTTILVRQFRTPLLYAAKQDETLEVIAGMTEGSEPAAVARREAMEEIGRASCRERV